MGLIIDRWLDRYIRITHIGNCLVDLIFLSCNSILMLSFRFLHIGRKEGEQESRKGQLRKEFGFLGLLAILFGTVVGSGIFVSPALILDRVSNGGIVLLVWIVAAIIGLLGGLCYAELGSFVRNAGGEFAFVHKAFSFNGKQPFKMISEILAFSMVWTQAAITRPSSIAIISLAFAEYVSKPFYPVYCAVPSSVVKLLAVAAMCEDKHECVCGRGDRQATHLANSDLYNIVNMFLLSLSPPSLLPLPLPSPFSLILHYHLP